MADVTQPWGLVHGRINVAVGDSTDAGRAPDKVPVASGLATFSATVDRLVTNTPGQESIDLPQKINASIVNGALQWGGTDDVPLIASAGKGWQWRVDFTNLKYVDPTTGQTLTLSSMGWLLDVKVYDPNFVDPVTGLNTTITQITDQAPVSAVSTPLLAKGDPGGVVDLSIGTVTTTTDIASVSASITPTTDPLKKKLNLVAFAGSGGGGGGSGTVTKINGVSPDGTGAVTLTPANIGAPTVQDVTTAQSTASNALSTANSAQAAANAAQTSANSAQSTANAAQASQSALAPKDSPTFTGDPKAPTPATTDNDTSIATTAYVRAAITTYAPTGSGGGTANQVYWNATTQAWTVTARPAVTGPVILWSTNDANATRPSWMAIGDSWVRHPDAVGG